MPRSFRYLASSLTAMMAASGAAWPDVLHLHNGDRISGTVIRITDALIAIQTEYAGEIRVNRDQVRAIETDEAKSFQTKDGETVRGRLRLDDGTQALETDNASAPFALEAIQLGAAGPEALEALVKEQERAQKPKLWSGALDSGITLRSGETDTLDASLDLTLTRKQPKNMLTLKFNAAYGEAESVLNTQRAGAQGKWQVYPRERLFYFGLAGLQHDQGRRLELRSTLGAGLGYDFIKTTRRRVSVEIGAEYTYERWENFSRGQRRRAVAAAREQAANRLDTILDSIFAMGPPLRFVSVIQAGDAIRDILDPDVLDKIREEDHIGLRLSAHHEESLFRNSRLTNDLAILPNVDEFGAYRILYDAAFTTPLTESLNLRVNLKTEYDSEPGPTNIEKFDVTLSTGVRWTF